MCLNRSEVFGIFCFISGVVLLICGYMLFLKTVFVSLNVPLQLKDLKPIGELVANIRVIQPVSYENKKIFDEKLSTLSLCVEILLANYSDRENRGAIRIGIEVDGRIEKQEIVAGKVKDNAYQRVCFKNVTLKELFGARKVNIFLEGVDSVRGSAVTAWTTRDIPYGALRTADERLKDRSLIFRIGYVKSSIDYRALPLVVIAALATTTLVVPLKRGEK